MKQRLMKTGKYVRILLVIIGLLALLWIGMTVWVENKGPESSITTGVGRFGSMLIVYDPDPITHFDRQVCSTFAKIFADNGWRVHLETVAAQHSLRDTFDVYVVCANTYNWAPDMAISNFISGKHFPEYKNVVAITLGGGTTLQSRQKLEELLIRKHNHLIASKELWLWRPNDKTRLKENNVAVALDITGKWAVKVLAQLCNDNQGKYCAMNLK